MSSSESPRRIHIVDSTLWISHCKFNTEFTVNSQCESPLTTPSKDSTEFSSPTYRVCRHCARTLYRILGDWIHHTIQMNRVRSRFINFFIFFYILNFIWRFSEIKWRSVCQPLPSNSYSPPEFSSMNISSQPNMNLILNLILWISDMIARSNMFKLHPLTAIGRTIECDFLFTNYWQSLLWSNEQSGR